MIDCTNLTFEQRKQIQDLPVGEALKQLIKVSHKHIPDNSRVCRLTLVLDAPGRKNSLILDYSPLHYTYIVRDPNLKLSLISHDDKI